MPTASLRRRWWHIVLIAMLWHTSSENRRAGCMMQLCTGASNGPYRDDRIGYADGERDGFTDHDLTATPCRDRDSNPGLAAVDLSQAKRGSESRKL
jgi:hypothetical protein